MASRAVAAAAAVLGTISGLLLVRAVVPGSLGDYVSASGVPGQAYATLYQAGIYGLAVTAGLLAYAARNVLLAGAVPMIVLSGSVTCTPGCPLPPYEQSTGQDLVHGATSILGVGLCALAMGASAWLGSRFSRVAVFVTWPLLAGTAIGIVFAGRGPATGVLERLALLACVGWLVGFAVILARPAYVRDRGVESGAPTPEKPPRSRRLRSGR
jgi:hypothetical protein